MVARYSPGVLMAKFDVEAAYRNIAVHPDDRFLLGMKWRDQYYVDLTLPFGLRSTPFIFNSVADMVEWILLNQHAVSDLLHYLDDFITAGPPHSAQCAYNLSTALTVCPLLFIIYMNDLPNVLESCSVTLYADDTVLYFSSKLISEIETKMNSDLKQVCDWLKLNQLTLNIKKSQFMLIGSNSRLRRIDSIVISADGKQLQDAQCFPYLGLIINQNLTWEDHIEHMRNKINKARSFAAH